MNISIKYNTKLISQNKNIVIFVSNLSQLRNIDFTMNFDLYLKNKDFINQFKKENSVILSNVYLKNSLFHNIIINLVKPKETNFIELGSFINTKVSNFKNIDNTNVTFIFPNKFRKPFKNFISDLVFGFCIKSYSFDKFKKNKKNIYNVFHLNLFKLNEFKDLKYKLNLLKSINFTKELVSEPANILNPEFYANKCLELRKIGLKVKILNKDQLEKIGMRCLLGVAQGSFNQPKVVVFEWNLKKNIKPTTLVGKGVTFDTGGISIKPSLGMEEMITDMGGSAVVVGSMMNAALNHSSHSLVGIIGLVENMPDGKAQRPGDIINSLSGQTIEVLNTDAEGRLVLADILTYIQKIYNPKQIIDFATLTGAIMIALGTHRAGLFSNNDSLSNKLFIAGEISNEKIWKLPMDKEYDNEINSLRADIKNIGSSRFGGSIHAAQFIKRFIDKKIPWAHIDIAGVSWTMKPDQNSFSKLHTPGATAFGVRLIDQFLKGK